MNASSTPRRRIRATSCANRAAARECANMCRTCRSRPSTLNVRVRAATTSTIWRSVTVPSRQIACCIVTTRSRPVYTDELARRSRLPARDASLLRICATLDASACSPSVAARTRVTALDSSGTASSPPSTCAASAMRMRASSWETIDRAIGRDLEELEMLSDARSRRMQDADLLLQRVGDVHLVVGAHDHGLGAGHLLEERHALLGAEDEQRLRQALRERSVLGHDRHRARRGGGIAGPRVEGVVVPLAVLPRESFVVPGG